MVLHPSVQAFDKAESVVMDLVDNTQLIRADSTVLMCLPIACKAANLLFFA